MNMKMKEYMKKNDIGPNAKIYEKRNISKDDIGPNAKMLFFCHLFIYF